MKIENLRKRVNKRSIKGLIAFLQLRVWLVAHYESEKGQKGSTLRPKCKLIVLWTTRKQAKKPVEMLKSRSYWCNQKQFLINISSIQSWIAMLELCYVTHNEINTYFPYCWEYPYLLGVLQFLVAFLWDIIWSEWSAKRWTTHTPHILLQIKATRNHY